LSTPVAAAAADPPLPSASSAGAPTRPTFASIIAIKKFPYSAGVCNEFTAASDMTPATSLTRFMIPFSFDRYGWSSGLISYKPNE